MYRFRTVQYCKEVVAVDLLMHLRFDRSGSISYDLDGSTARHYYCSTVLYKEYTEYTSTTVHSPLPVATAISRAAVPRLIIL